MRLRRGALALIFCALMLGCGHGQVPLPRAPESMPADNSGSIARGEYIVRNVAVCGSCHAADSKHDPDGPLSGGMEFADWRIGVARASNLTPDRETGLGDWSEAEIVRAIRNGQARDGRLLAPVMPYEWFQGMSDDDAFAVARYLKSQTPVKNQIVQNPSFLFKVGKLLFLRPKPGIAVPAPASGATPEYGGYLAQHVGLCGDCHTQRTGLLQKPDRSRLFAGMPKPPKDFPEKPSNITPDPKAGIGNWSEADFVRALRTGKTPDGDSLHPFMPWHQLTRMNDNDLIAINRYLHSLPPLH